MSIKILVAEDDADIRLGLIATLESEGHDVVAASDGAQALKLYGTSPFDLVVLDVMMPKLSGYDVCRELRAKGERVPVLFLTAKGEEIDKVVGLKLGGDDYVTKPFGVHELLARVEALVRRHRRSSGMLDDKTDGLPAILKLGQAEIDRDQFVGKVAGRIFPITPREMKLVEFMAARRGSVLTRDELLNGAWGVDYFGTTRTLDQHVAQLRKKIETQPDHPEVIVTVHGVGYRLVG
jgi:DNA-binding response OmpR family regulator